MKATFTDAFAKNVTVPGRYTDPATKGLNLNVKNGRKYWVLRYTLAGLRRDLTLGSYPAISLKEARNRAVACRAELIAGREPNGYWKAPVRTGAQISETLTFREFAQECIKAKSHEWRNQKHGEQWHNTLAKYADPVIGSLPLDAIDTEHILKILTPIWHTKTETASRLRAGDPIAEIGAQVNRIHRIQAAGADQSILMPERELIAAGRGEPGLRMGDEGPRVVDVVARLRPG